MEQIKYIVPYDSEDNICENRIYSFAAKSKVEYISDVLDRLGYYTEFVSLSNTKNKKGFYPSKRIELTKNKALVLCPTFGANSKVTKLLRYVFSGLWLFFWLYINTKYNEQIIIYHTQTYIPIILLLKRLKNLQIILELEEFYYKFGLCSKRTEKNEKKMIYYSDKYIMSNANQINEFIFIKDRPHCVVHGNYNTPKKMMNHFKENIRIVVLFAGGIDRIRNSAFNALQTARYLGHDYLLKIIGYGDDSEISILCGEIDRTNSELGYEACIYCGTKTGKDLEDFYTQGDIALNLQNVHDYYMDFAFPSKIIAYLSHGLNVVSTKIKTLETSTIADYIVFTETLEPKNIATIIKSIDITKPNNSRSHIKKLDGIFEIKLHQVLIAKRI